MAVHPQCEPPHCWRGRDNQREGTEMVGSFLQGQPRKCMKIFNYDFVFRWCMVFFTGFCAKRLWFVLQPCRHAPKVSAFLFLSPALSFALLLWMCSLYMISIMLQAMTFHKCNSLRIKDLTVVNSQQMHMAFTNCIRVSVSNIKLLAPSSSPNTDAIHISSSRGVQVTDSTFMTGQHLH